MRLGDQLGNQSGGSAIAWPGGAGERLSDLLRQQVQRYPAEPACVLLDRDGREVTRMTYRELDRRARAVAAAMQRHVAPGERALLAFPTGTDFVVGLFACVYAGIVAVPVPCPGEGAASRQARLAGIARDAAPSLVLTTAEIADRPDRYGLGGIRPIAVARVPGEMAGQFGDPRPVPDTAFLQYTSGSTRDPKGVQISHRNVLANLADLYATVPMSLPGGDRIRIVTWLPLFHDMGLAQVFCSVFQAGLIVLIPPEFFLLRPVMWLQAMTRYQAHMSTAPNFGYDLCARRVTGEQRHGLDLSAWRLALNGSEPVRAGTLEIFAREFAAAGFDPAAFVPCYGLAEGTFYISGTRGIPHRLTMSVPALEHESVVRAPDGDERDRQVISCGPVAAGLDLRIVGPGTRRECSPDQVGEIWVAGDSISRGYWGQTDGRFGASLADGTGGQFLRTGDLGFRSDGELYVLGRHDDVIIVDGRNHYPQDIEATAQQSHAALAAGRVAAFGYRRNDETAVAVVAETARGIRVAALDSAVKPGEAGGAEVDGAEVVRAVRAAVSAEHQISAAQVVLLRPAALPRTSSGKVRRRRCRELLLAGGLETW